MFLFLALLNPYPAPPTIQDCRPENLRGKGKKILLDFLLFFIFILDGFVLLSFIFQYCHTERANASRSISNTFLKSVRKCLLIYYVGLIPTSFFISNIFYCFILPRGKKEPFRTFLSPLRTPFTSQRLGDIPKTPFGMWKKIFLDFLFVPYVTINRNVISLICHSDRKNAKGILKSKNLF